MTEVYAVSMNKGGVGKTSLVSNLAGAISKSEKKKILIIDTDRQGNSSIAFGLNHSEFHDFCPLNTRKIRKSIMLIRREDEINIELITFQSITTVHGLPIN